MVAIEKDVKEPIALTASGRKLEDNTVEALVSIRPPEGTENCPIDVVCVVDVSGSMEEEAKTTDGKGRTETHGLSVLDVVVHAVKTIAASLGKEDRIALVTFNQSATTSFQLQNMTDSNSKVLLKKLDDLVADGSTNIWDGLHTGLEILRKAAESNQGRRLGHLILLTDGQPTISPPRGEKMMLKRYIDQNPNLPGTINTFGFGYSINSELLLDMAVQGGGMYCFIPDSTIVGTAFVNCVTNLKVTTARRAVLSVELLNGATLIGDKVPGGYETSKTEWGIQYNLSSLQYGQSKDVVLRLSVKDLQSPYLAATLRYETGTVGEAIQVSVEGKSLDDDKEVQVQSLRLDFADLLFNLKDAKLVKEWAKKAKETPVYSDQRIKDIVADAEGQVLEATEKTESYDRWGKHFLPSLRRAHLFQQCNNFKDPGVQNYGGAMFRATRDKIDDIFCQLPPPNPKPKVNRNNFSTAKAAPAQPVNMRNVYYNAYGGCFRAHCKAAMADGSLKPVGEIKRGDLVSVPNGESSQVLCVMKTVYPQGKAKIVNLSGLELTPYHPVRINGKWNFPIDLAEEKEIECDSVFSFLLEKGHVMTIEGVECVTLAHGFTEDRVIAHSYLGTDLVAQDLKRMNGWEQGLVQITPDSFVRDSKTNAICGLTQSEQLAS
eukprot:TRINITY_DN30_c0_g3_i1.p1 TRINITY_DN30_c0_g3~~TRINITY_DN30_c0_g3_i1.p1  ORF type:complete len:660 (-),score=241.11 TRINITY_DN30_c0_g3_i1:53-2032(-)